MSRGSLITAQLTLIDTCPTALSSQLTREPVCTECLLRAITQTTEAIMRVRVRGNPMNNVNRNETSAEAGTGQQ